MKVRGDNAPANAFSLEEQPDKPGYCLVRFYENVAPFSETQGELTISGFTTTYGGWASIFTAVALCCFAFSTIIGWGLYGSRFVQFLFGSNKVVRPLLVIYSFVSILGATLDLGLLWDIADTFNGLMSIPNLIALLLLSGTVVQMTRAFFESEG